MSPSKNRKEKFSKLDFIKLGLTFPLFCKVATKKGCRLRGTFEGTVRGYSTWRNYLAVNIKKNDGKIVQCLAKNLVRVK